VKGTAESVRAIEPTGGDVLEETVADRNSSFFGFLGSTHTFDEFGVDEAGGN
jgi:hypothetical protein